MSTVDYADTHDYIQTVRQWLPTSIAAVAPP